MSPIQTSAIEARALLHLNQAPRETLADVPGLDAQQVQALVEARPFADWDEVERAAGLSGEAVAALKQADAQLSEASEGPIGEPGSGGEPGRNLGRA